MCRMGTVPKTNSMGDAVQEKGACVRVCVCVCVCVCVEKIGRVYSSTSLPYVNGFDREDASETVRLNLE